MRKKTQWKAAAAALLTAGALTFLAALGALERLDLAASDALYQSRQAFDGNIVLVSIDQRALEEIGPYGQWERDMIATALEALNESEDCRPAVIALDILCVGETEPGLDLWLAEAAGRYGNVVTASFAQLGAALTKGRDGGLYLDDFSVLAYEEPYAALRDATAQGHINTVLDSDGVLRRHLLQITLPDGETVPSMALAAARAFRD